MIGSDLVLRDNEGLLERTRTRFGRGASCFFCPISLPCRRCTDFSSSEQTRRLRTRHRRPLRSRRFPRIRQSRWRTEGEEARVGSGSEGGGRAEEGEGVGVSWTRGFFVRLRWYLRSVSVRLGCKETREAVRRRSGKPERALALLKLREKLLRSPAALSDVGAGRIVVWAELCVFPLFGFAPSFNFSRSLPTRSSSSVQAQQASDSLSAAYACRTTLFLSLPALLAVNQHPPTFLIIPRPSGQ
jgi:hypothetical protein